MITHIDANFSYRQKGIYPSKNYYARLVQLKTSFFLDLNLLLFFFLFFVFFVQFFAIDFLFSGLYLPCVAQTKKLISLSRNN